MKIMKIVCNLCESQGNGDNPIGGFIVEDDGTVRLVSCSLASFHLCESCIKGINYVNHS
jgi:hypothetical protein